MTDPLLIAYDEHLRGDSEMVGVASWDRAGPLWRASFAGPSGAPTSGFVTYESLAGYDAAELLVEALAFYTAQPSIETVEWKTRGHDGVDGLAEILESAGFVAEPRETVMIGAVADLLDARNRPASLPTGTAVTAVDPGDDRLLRRASEVQDAVFGDTRDLRDLVAAGDGHVEVFVAEVEGEVVSVGRLDRVPGTTFAGMWGGGTLMPWRGRGLYRAMTMARAERARERGIDYLFSDCTDMSRPILERCGLRAVTTTTPYVWRR